MHSNLLDSKRLFADILALGGLEVLSTSNVTLALQIGLVIARIVWELVLLRRGKGRKRG